MFKVSRESQEKNICLSIAYDGTGYFGWQRQPDRLTIQGVIEDKIQMMVGKPISLIGSGRTDAGVHALHQVANFRTYTNITASAFFRALNSLLPENILIREAVEVPLEFHARYDVKAKVYEYRIYREKLPSPFLRHYVWHIPHALDLEPMGKCLKILKGSHDFSSFCSAGDKRVDPVRTMFESVLSIEAGNILSFCFKANGFLRHMVRNIMGTVVEVGLGDLSVQGFGEILKCRDRQKAKVKAPPGGLYLKEVMY